MVDKERMKQFACLHSRVLQIENKSKTAALQNYPESRKTKLLSLLLLRPSFVSWRVNAKNFTTT